MIEAIVFTRPDDCCECGGKGSIFVYDEKGVEYNYRQIINSKHSDGKLLNFINKTTLTHFRCVKCGKKFNIRWEENFPIPLTNEDKIPSFIKGIKKE